MNKKVTIQVKTDCDFFTAIFKRIYLLDIHEQNDDVLTISLKSNDYSPSGYLKGGSENLLLEFEEYRIPKDMTNKRFMAKLILKIDNELKKHSGCDQLNKSRKIILDKIQKISNTKEHVNEI